MDVSVLMFIAFVVAVTNTVYAVGDHNSINSADDAALCRSWRSAIPQEMTQYLAKDQVSAGHCTASSSISSTRAPARHASVHVPKAVAFSLSLSSTISSTLPTESKQEVCGDAEQVQQAQHQLVAHGRQERD
jgi:hypothetical protein